MSDTGTIGWAVAKMKNGWRVRRRGWYGKGTLGLWAGFPKGILIEAEDSNTVQATGEKEGTVCAFLPYVMMRTAQGAFIPWICSQSDLLAEDWERT